MAQQLLDNFKAFNDPKNPDYITPQGLKAKAETPLTKYPHKNQDIRLAREIMKRPDLLKALDRDGRTGGGWMLRSAVKTSMTSSALTTP